MRAALRAIAQHGEDWLAAGGALTALWWVARLGGSGDSPRRRYLLGAAVAVGGWWLVAICGE